MNETTSVTDGNSTGTRCLTIPQGAVGLRIPNESPLETYTVLPQWINLPDRAHRPELVSFRDRDGVTVHTSAFASETTAIDGYYCPDTNAFVIVPDRLRGKARFGALTLADFLQPEKTFVTMSVNVPYRGQGSRFEDFLRVPISALFEANSPVDCGLFINEQNGIRVLPLAKLPSQENVYGAIATSARFTERENRLLATDTRPFADAYEVSLLYAR